MTKVADLDYTYTGSESYQPPSAGLRDPQGREYFPYLPEPGLKKALNLAITLQRPLLLEGEPGCGKTRIASALAYELSCKQLGKNKHPNPTKLADWWNFYIWNVTSSSRAQDGLYTFDAVGRLRDAQLMGTDPARLQQFLGDEAQALEKRMRDKTQYREFGALGQALRNQTYRPVLLIDEIDKADSDFPNDLLLELDELRFTIPETGEPVGPPQPHNKPIVLITSNREKPLPEPFLRRCLYYYVQFPQTDILKRIIQARFGERIANKAQIVSQALEKFDAIHTLLERQPGSRPPGTSELLEFLTVLIQDGKPVEAAIAELENLAEELPLLGTLIKTKADQDLYVKGR
ncbi:MAG: MoxR family ATPase [Nodosilinea sp.]